MRDEWRSFTPGIWEKEINVRDLVMRHFLKVLQMIQRLSGLR